MNDETRDNDQQQTDATASKRHPVFGTEMPDEVAGPPGPEPTRYGDWEVKGRCSDF